jgi:hypothetical protein
MLRRLFSVIAAALAAAAVGVPAAQPSAGVGPKVDPLAESYLLGKGLTPSEVASLTTGVCSAGAASCYTLVERARIATTGPKVDPLAVSYLQGRGLTPAEVRSWTVGACSRESRPASCDALLTGARAAISRPKVDPLAVSYLQGLGLTPDEVRSWTVGACSQADKAASCFAAFERTTAPAPAAAARPGGFDWRDAGIGAGATIGLVLLLAGLGAAFVTSRQIRRRQVPSV